jgi:hypothetical protein
LVDKARLAEDLMQYANRYKTTNEAIAKALRAYQLFERDRNYLHPTKKFQLHWTRWNRVQVNVFQMSITTPK